MIFIGPHVSISESVSLSPARAEATGATGFAIFTKNQRVWKAPALKEEDVTAFRNNLKEKGFCPEAILPHAGYLINPATPDEALWEKSLSLFLEEASRTARLGLEKINIHPGAYKEGDRKDGILRAARMIDKVLEETDDVSIAIENTAGAGTILGSSFEELDMLLDAVKHPERTGFTLDTAHLYGAGYDVKGDPASILDSLDIPHESKIYLSDMERYSTGDCVITPVPVPHMEYHESSPCHSDFFGYILEYGGMRIFHGGDMISEPELIERLREYSSFDYAFLPINGRDSERESRGIIGNMHPDEAVEFALEIHARTLVPTHFDMIAGNTGDLQAFRNAAERRIGYIVPVPGKAIELNPF